MVERYKQLGSDIVDTGKLEMITVAMTNNITPTEIFNRTYHRVAQCFTEERAKLITKLLNEHERKTNQDTESSH